MLKIGSTIVSYLGCVALLVGCDVFMPNGFDEKCDTSYWSTVVTTKINGSPGAFMGKANLQDIVGSADRSSDGHCYGGTENKSRSSSDTFELNICTPDETSENKSDLIFFYILEHAYDNKTADIQQAILVLMAYYFESCDIFEEPKGKI